MTRETLATAVLISAIFAGLFALGGGAACGHTLRSVAFSAVAGAIIGAMAAPEVDPKRFRFPAAWQMAFAVLGCLVFALAMDAPPEGYLLAVVGGAVLGYAAPVWIKHVRP